MAVVQGEPLVLGQIAEDRQMTGGFDDLFQMLITAVVLHLIEDDAADSCGR